MKIILKIFTLDCVHINYKLSSALEGIVILKTDASFTTDLQKAKEFRGSNGMIICLNMQLLLSYKENTLAACDVSWVSDYPDEKEILIARFSNINFNARKIFKSDDDNQWIIGDDRRITTKKIMCNEAFPGEMI